MAYRMAPLPMLLHDLEGHLLTETFLTPIPRETQQELTNIARRASSLR